MNHGVDGFGDSVAHVAKRLRTQVGVEFALTVKHIKHALADFRRSTIS